MLCSKLHCQKVCIETFFLYNPPHMVDFDGFVRSEFQTQRDQSCTTWGPKVDYVRQVDFRWNVCSPPCGLGKTGSSGTSRTSPSLLPSRSYSLTNDGPGGFRTFEVGHSTWVARQTASVRVWSILWKRVRARVGRSWNANKQPACVGHSRGGRNRVLSPPLRLKSRGFITCRTNPWSVEQIGTNKTVRARFWSWLSGESPWTLYRCSHSARTRTLRCSCSWHETIRFQEYDVPVL